MLNKLKNLTKNIYDTNGITVIIPSYKPQNYIYECLISLHNQTLEKKLFEIILILNGCDEPFFSNLCSFAETNMWDNNISIIQTDAPGVSNARNLGIENARGDYICFVDDDDILSDYYLEGLYKKREKNNIVISNRKIFSTDINFSISFDLYEKARGKAKVDVLPFRNYLSNPWAKLIPKSLINNRRFNTKFQNGEDGLFMFTISDDLEYFTVADSSAIYYIRCRSGSLSRKIRFFKLVFNSYKLFFVYVILFVRYIPRYRLLLFVTRLLACIKVCLLHFKI